MPRFSDNNKIVIAATTTSGAAGTTAITSDAVDVSGFGGCCFLVPLGAIVGGAVTSLKVQQSSDDAATDDYSDVAGTSQTIADTDDDKLKYVDVLLPQKRYLKLLISRGTANATIGGILAVLYDAKGARPITQGTSVAGEQFVGPAEGTA
jgi:hypothetical protein